MTTIFYKNIDNDIKKYMPDFVFTVKMYIYPCFERKKTICVVGHQGNDMIARCRFVEKTVIPIKKIKYRNFYTNLENVVYISSK